MNYNIVELETVENIIVKEKVNSGTVLFKIVDKINHKVLLQGNSYFILLGLFNLICDKKINKEEYKILKNFFMSYDR